MESSSSEGPPKRILLVEGETDRHFIGYLHREMNLKPSFEVIPCRRVSRLIKIIEAEILAEGREAIGILVDTDESLGVRWGEIAKSVRKVGIELPSRPSREGTIIEGSPRIGIWLMPDNDSSGELENFVGDTIPSGDHVWPLSERYIDSIPEEHRRFGSISYKTEKAKVYAWLATRRRPGLIGPALNAGELDIDVPIVRSFVRWLERLFG